MQLACITEISTSDDCPLFIMYTCMKRVPISWEQCQDISTELHQRNLHNIKEYELITGQHNINGCVDRHPCEMVKGSIIIDCSHIFQITSLSLKRHPCNSNIQVFT